MIANNDPPTVFTNFKTSSYSADNGTCVEVATAATSAGQRVAIGDTKDPSGEFLETSWSQFARLRRLVLAQADGLRTPA